MNLLTDAIRADAEYGDLLRVAREEFRKKNPLPIQVNGLCEGADEAFCVSLLHDLRQQGPALILCHEEKECVRLRGVLEQCGLRAAFFMGRDLTFYSITASHEYEHERLKVLFGLLRGAYDAVLTTPDAALSYTMPTATLTERTLRLDLSTVAEPASLAQQLTAAGYSRVDMVDSAGQFALRGGIVDIFPPYAVYEDGEGEDNGSHPVRLEFFGDEIDRMGIFETDTQRISRNITAVEFPPAREVLVGEEAREKLRAAIGSLFKKTKDARAAEELARERAELDGGGEIHFADKYLTLIYPERECLLDYLSGGMHPVLIRSTHAVSDRLKAGEWHRNQVVEELLESGTVASKYTDYDKPAAHLDLFLDRNVTLHLDSLSRGLSGRKLAGLFGFSTKHMVSYAENFPLLCEDLRGYASSRYRVAVTAENETAAQNLCEMLCEADFRAAMDREPDFLSREWQRGEIRVCIGGTTAGYELTAPRIAILSTCAELRGRGTAAGARLRRQSRKKSGSQAILSYAELEVGDYVVHENYGIGKYMGIENMVVGGVARDYITIQYAGSDKLFLPVEKMDMVSKYIGAHSDDGLVKLSRFGGAEWGKAKARAKSAVKEMAKELIKLYAERMRRPGYAFPPDDDFQRDFEASFSYEETQGQLNAVEDIKKDMMRTVPMDRLLCGDVGFGKTEVAIRAAYKAVLGGKQVAILVPTTILALQHYQTCISRLRGFAVDVDMISRFRTKKQQDQTLRRLARGDLDIIIGTHRLLSNDIQFHDLGLLVVDEEQRFGVAAKEKLKQRSQNIDVLTLSATPIPRTLNMAMGGIRDISVLDEAPGDRLPVQTYVLEQDDMIVEEAIRRELRRGGQVFYLHNNIENIDLLAGKLSQAIPEAHIVIAHGKMEKEQLEDIWSAMLSGEIDVLVCTTIIETGIDVPNANTLIVDNAHRLGLSQLHQLRGRVGRSSRRAYAYFTYPKDMAISEIATKRLEAIREYAEFGAGFKIAMRDLEIRGAGNLLGTQQHGHLDAVGYDMYIKLLNEAVLEERGEKPAEKPECLVTVDLNAYLPEKYVPYPAQRMALYKRIALIGTAADRDDLADELMDRYGDLPRPADNLLDIALLHAGGVRCGLKAIRQNGLSVELVPLHIDIEVWSELAEEYPGRLRMVMESEPYLQFRVAKKEQMMAQVNGLLEKYHKIVTKNG
ncbi:MAG: transcription-repair coupling factor [Clostridia bacterium]|nr:transcription-repair coupling factor [Clostridia bacterium]